MENETQNQIIEELISEPAKPKRDYLLSASILMSAIIIAGAWASTADPEAPGSLQKTIIDANAQKNAKTNTIEEKVLPSEGIVLPVRWGDLGAKMISVGVIDREKFEKLYASPVRNRISNGASRGGLPAEAPARAQRAGRSAQAGLDDEIRSLLYSTSNGNLKITSENSRMILNLLWALGLGTKNDILERREMNNPRYGGVGGLASVGGFTLAEGNALDHYSRHPFIILNESQQEIVERVAKNIYRPCCNNPTHLPDCNHGMAMLGLLELMASQGISEEEMYKTALQVNAYWFPDTYLTIAKYFEMRGVDWNEVNPKEILGSAYSSASGYQKILSQVTAPAEKRGGGCGV